MEITTIITTIMETTITIMGIIIATVTGAPAAITIIKATITTRTIMATVIPTETS